MVNWTNVAKRIQTVIDDLGESTPCTVSHLSGNSSSGKIVFSQTDQVDASVADVGTVATTTRTAYIDYSVTTEICTGDTVTANGVSYRVREVRKYEPGTSVNIAWRVTLDV